MSKTAGDEVAEVMDRVQHWPTPTRITLARRILESLDGSPGGPPTSTSTPPLNRPLRGVPVDAVAGRFRGDGPAPTDAECRQILEEELWSKYGS